MNGIAPGVPAKFLIGVGVSAFLSVLSLNSLPLLTGALLDHLKVNEAQAGVLGTIEMLSVSLAAFVAASWAGKISCAKLALAGAAIATAGQFLIAYTGHLHALTALRIMAGAGFGFAYAAGTMAAASTANPDRVLGYANAIALIAVVLYLPGLALLIASSGYKGAYLALGVLIICLAPVLLWLQDGTGVKATPGTQAVAPLKPLIGLLSSIAFYNIGAGAVWGFSERMGLQAGFSVEETGFIIAIGAVSGMAGSLFAGWLGDQWGRKLAVVVALVASGLAYLLMAMIQSGLGYVAGINIYWAAYMFLLPLFIGTGAVLDGGARAATLAAATISLTIGVGPACGGLIATWFSYSAIGWFACALCALSAVLFLSIDLKAARS